MRSRVAAASLCLLVSSAAFAAEGMWQPQQLPEIAERLKQAGLEIDPATISALDRYPMNAVVGLGFCTGSFVSPEGLVATNHHCAYGAIQYNSTAERNLLENGFLAEDFAAELPGDPALRVYVTESIRDVTADFHAAIEGAGADGRAVYDAVDARSKALVRACEADKMHRCDVYVFNGGAEFHLISQLEIRDVRLVYAPPEAIGKFGGDVDNWMWPRHTGDYSFLRAYVGRNGKPALHDSKNVPYKPKSWLKVDGDGLQPGDYAMVLGYPGRTNRWRLAEELQDVIDWAYPTSLKEYSEILRVIDESTRARPDAAVKYASVVAGLNNTVKNYEGQLTGFARIGGARSKREQEQALAAWLGQRGDATASAALADLRQELAGARARREQEFYFGLLVPYTSPASPRVNRDGSPLAAAMDLYRWSREREKPDAKREFGYQERDGARLKARFETFDRRYDAQTDRALFEYRARRYAALPAAQRIPELDAWLGIAGDAPDLAGIGAKLDAYYAGTQIADARTRLGWFDAPRKVFEGSTDSALRLAVALYPAVERLETAYKAQLGREYRLRPPYLAAVAAYQRSNGRAVFPDANNSLRVTYGNVMGYSPRDAVSYGPLTTLDGVAQKTSKAPPFNTPEAQLAAMRERRYGSYADSRLGTVPVNFMADLDITGGNSGSPTLNGKAELVGLVFDGNWESVSSNWIFDPAMTRSIHVDIRYMLWVMDEVDHAERLIREMGLTPASP